MRTIGRVVMHRNVLAACLFAIGVAGCTNDSARAADAADDAGLSRLELIGKRLFFDTTLSNPPGQSCGSCHEPASGFSGNFGSVEGVPRAADGVTLGLRNTPTATYARFTPAFTLTSIGGREVANGGQFLDGRAASLEEQAGIPFFSAGEMNLANPSELASRLAAASYASLLVEEFGAGFFGDPALVLRSATRAIAAFERTARFAPFSSKFDAFAAGHAALSDLEAEGLALFRDPLRGNCAQCHAFEPGLPLFTDFSYHNLGVPRNPRIPANADPAFFDLGLCGPRRARVADDRLCGAFKVPTLRNVARKSAFMHNGFFTNLRDVVAFHVRRDATAVNDVPLEFRGNIELAPVPPGLGEREIDAITAFVRALDDGYAASGIPGAQ